MTPQGNGNGNDSNGKNANPYLVARWERAVQQLDVHEQMRAHAFAALRERRAEAAALGDPPVRPATPWLLFVSGLLGISLTFALAFHDIVFSNLFVVREQALLASLLAAMTIGGLVMFATLGGARLGGRHGSSVAATGWGLALALATALLLLRLSSTASPEQRLLAVGFSLLELAAVLLVERFSARLCRSWRDYLADQETWRACERQVQVAIEHLANAEEELARRSGVVEDVEKALVDPVDARSGPGPGRGHAPTPSGPGNGADWPTT